jgi:hypothetical protein
LFSSNVSPAGAGGLPVTIEFVPTWSKNASGRAGRTSPAARAAGRVLTI